MSNNINDLDFIRNIDLMASYDERYKRQATFSNHSTDDTCNKLWYRKLLKAVKMVEQDLNEKSLKMNTLRNNLGFLTSMSSKLIFKEVEENLMLLKKNLNHIYSFMIEMNKLDIKYEAIVYDCDPGNNDGRQNVQSHKQISSKSETRVVETSFSAFQQRVTPSPSSLYSTAVSDTLTSTTSRRDYGSSELGQLMTRSKSLQTPNKYFKDLHGYASPVLPKSNKSSPASCKSTPRKNAIPRRRTIINEQYVPTSDSSEPSSFFNDTFSEGVHVKGDLIVEELINYPVLHEKLAQSINRVFNGENVPIPDDKNEASSNLHQNQSHSNHSTHIHHHENSTTNDNSISIKSPDANDVLDRTLTEEGNNIEANEIQLPETAIQDILSGLENDPVFNDFLNICSNKRDIYTTGTSSPLTSSSLTTPKSDDTHFKSPFSTPVRTYPSINCVVKDLMNDLKTPEKSQSVTSPLSSAIESSINDSTYNLSDSSQITPIIDFNSLINSPLKDVQPSVTVQSSYAPYSMPIPISLQSQDGTLVINNAMDSNLIGVVNKKKDQNLNKMSSSNVLKKMPLKNKKVNLARIESSNMQSLQRRLSEKTDQYRMIAPKSQEAATTSCTSTSSSTKKNPASSTKRTNLKAKFSEAAKPIESTSNKKEENKTQNDVFLLKSMNVDKFLSLIHKKSSKP